MNALKELVAQKRQTLLKEQEESRLEIEFWSKKVNELYQQITTWLKPLTEDGSIRIERSPVYGTDNFGTWNVEGENRTVADTIDTLSVVFFNGEKIHFIPVGLNIVGGYGRVDLALGLRKWMIVLKEKEGEWFYTESYGLAKSPLHKFTQTSFEQLVTEFVETF
jgi:hypothetical protein